MRSSSRRTGEEGWNGLCACGERERVWCVSSVLCVKRKRERVWTKRDTRTHGTGPGFFCFCFSFGWLGVLQRGEGGKGSHTNCSRLLCLIAGSTRNTTRGGGTGWGHSRACAGPRKGKKWGGRGTGGGGAGTRLENENHNGWGGKKTKEVWRSVLPPSLTPPPQSPRPRPPRRPGPGRMGPTGPGAGRRRRPGRAGRRASTCLRRAGASAG